LPFTHLPSMYKPSGCSYVMLGVSIFAVKDMIGYRGIKTFSGITV